MPIFERADLAERPPKAYRDLPPPPGWAMREASTLEEADRLCRGLGASTAQMNGKRRINGCADHATRQIVYPAIGKGVDRAQQARTLEHEIGHAYDLYHPPDAGHGRGWIDQFGNDPSRMTEQQAAALRAQLLAQYNLFAQVAQQQAPQQDNLFRAR